MHESQEWINQLWAGTTGFIYPNELEVRWSVLIVCYPYITGLVAGAFILASLVKVFNVKELYPTYRLALLTALSFMIVAPIPLNLHLGRPERAYEIFLTPNPSSAMAMFGFVYLWYLMAVLLLEVWFEYRHDLVVWARTSKFPLSFIYRVLSLFSTDVTPEAVAFDKKAVRVITIIGIPSAFFLHGYVGFIFGSIKANPWWSSVLMPIVFLMSAIVSGIALVVVLYMLLVPGRGGKLDMKCLDTITSYLFYAVIVDFSLEFLDFIHRLYESEESIEILGSLLTGKLMISLVVIQILLGMIIPMILLVIVKSFNFDDDLRKLLYIVSAILIQVGIFSTRWNIVIGGQLFSKSFRGLLTYHLEFFGIEGLVGAVAVLILPFVVLGIMVRMFPPWDKSHVPEVVAAS